MTARQWRRRGLGGVRGAALARWQASGWPDAKAESWRFTRLGTAVARERAPATDAGQTGREFGRESGAEITAIATEMNAHVIRFYNGMLDIRSLDGLPGGISATQSLWL